MVQCVESALQVLQQSCTDARAGLLKKAELPRIAAFEMCCQRRLFESPLDSKETTPVIPVESTLDIPLQGLLLKLKSRDEKSRLTGKP